MYSRRTIDDFVAQKALALVGVSRSGQGFGNSVRKELAGQGYTIRVVHPDAETIAGERCSHSLAEVAAEVGGAILVTPPAETSKLVEEAAAAGISRVWIQQGAESADAIAYCESHGVDVVHHQCILMFAAHAGGVHRFHRGILKLFGRLPR